MSPLFYLAPQAFLVVFAVLMRCQCSEDVISKVALGWEEATVGTEEPILWRHRRADFTFHIFCEAISHFVKIENSVGDDAVNLPYNSFIKSLVDVGGFSHGDGIGGKTTSRFTVVFSFSPFMAKVAFSFCIFSPLATQRLLVVPNEAESTAKSVYVPPYGFGH